MGFGVTKEDHQHVLLTDAIDHGFKGVKITLPNYLVIILSKPEKDLYCEDESSAEICIG